MRAAGHQPPETRDQRLSTVSYSSLVLLFLFPYRLTAMAAAANSGVDVLFSQFSSVLQDIKLTFVDRQLPLCTADQLTVVRDVTSAVRLSENRLVSFVVEAAMRMERTQKSRMKTASARIAEKIMLKK